ncbi:uncharacterized protein LTR77_000321 [Saxophila tyrrhenica]|uniref:Uncharacterized protein n=1 Tax=Saxophila tyrrhenica TaxID=1690608 RepID=A0AAV9PMQ2_9PEZI|nr:hypothetical protein LTR77_000321 [Saxophila tyrrhenica]
MEVRIGVIEAAAFDGLEKALLGDGSSAFDFLRPRPGIEVTLKGIQRPVQLFDFKQHERYYLHSAVFTTMAV